MSDPIQEFMEDYVPKFVPEEISTTLTIFLDICDAEEKRNPLAASRITLALSALRGSVFELRMHPKRGLFLLGRKPDLRSRSAHHDPLIFITLSFAAKY
jgi:hypothetical protein